MRALDPTESERMRASIAKLLTEFKLRFPGDAACHAALIKVRWPNGVACPRCGATVSGKPILGRFKCKRCGDYRFSAFAKFRPFLKSHIPLSVWFAVIFLDSRIRFRAEDLAPKSKPQLGVSVNAVRRMRHSIRAARNRPVFRDLARLIGEKPVESAPTEVPLLAKVPMLPTVLIPPGTIRVSVYPLPHRTEERCWRCKMRAAVTVEAWTRGSRQLTRWDLCRVCKAEPLKSAAARLIKVKII
jgi:hypothetical protein